MEKVEINENTSIPLFAVLVSLPVFIGGIFWLSSIASDASASVKRLDRVEDAVIQMRQDLSYLRAREEIREKQNK